MKLLKRAFTLVEVLVVVAVIAVLAGIIFPVAASAVKSAHRTDCISNLRQSGQALLIYESDWNELPVGAGAYSALAKAPTCDKEDSWRPNCTASTTVPRVGSYGYVRLCPDFADETAWSTASASETPPSILISIFYGNRQVRPFEGMEVNIAQCLKVHMDGCAMPDRLVTLDFDGSAHHRHAGSTKIVAGVAYQLFTWPSAFIANQHGN